MDIELKFRKYLRSNNPEVITLEPTIIEVIGDIIVFKFKNDSQQYCVSIKS